MSTATVKNFVENGNAATRILSVNRKRIWLMVQNDSDEELAFGFSKETTFADGPNAGIKLQAGESIPFPAIQSALGANGFALYMVHGGADTLNPTVRILQLPSVTPTV